MHKSFKYDGFRRWYPFIITPPFVLLAYVFLKAATQTSNLFNSFLFIIIAYLILVIPFSVARETRIIVVTNDNGLLIQKFLKKTFIPWEDITEFGKYRRIVYVGGAWCYYVKRSPVDKKVVIGLEYFKNIHLLNNIIIQNARSAKLVNTSKMY